MTIAPDTTERGYSRAVITGTRVPDEPEAFAAILAQQVALLAEDAARHGHRLTDDKPTVDLAYAASLPEGGTIPVDRADLADLARVTITISAVPETDPVTLPVDQPVAVHTYAEITVPAPPRGDGVGFMVAALEWAARQHLTAAEYDITDEAPRVVWDADDDGSNPTITYRFEVRA